MVLENICFLLNNFIRCSEYENIVFCWVMHEQAIIDEFVSRRCVPPGFFCRLTPRRRDLNGDRAAAEAAR